jgi:hypothetical protein
MPVVSIALGFRTEQALMHLGLIDRPFVSHVKIMGALLLY